MPFLNRLQLAALTSELAIYLTGRYVEIHLFTLSFSEYIQFKIARTGNTELIAKSEFKKRDNHPKYVVTMDEFWKDNIEGVKHMHIADFLLMENWM